MKKRFILPIFLGISFGFIFGKLFFNNYSENNMTVFQEGEKVYFVRLDYSKKYIDANGLLLLSNDNGNYLYSGITKDKKVAEKIKDFYKNDYSNIVIEEKYINNYSFITVLNEYDKIAKLSKGEELSNVESIVLSNYKEMVLENES